MNKPRLVADQNMPLVEALFGHLFDVQLLPGREITAPSIKGAEVLLVRSVTAVNQPLLAGSSVRFVGSATAGTDHVDLDYLATSDIQFAHAPGCNAHAVVQYVLSVLCCLKPQWQQCRVGIVGCGNVGGLLYRQLCALGVQCLVYDPFLDSGDIADLCAFEQVLDCDIISVHTPLTTSGPYPTQHMFNRQTLQRIKPTSLLINAGRGAVVDNTALLSLLKQQGGLQVALDVWESEPQINTELLDLVAMATPHIAGYSNEGKMRGTLMLFDSLSQYYPLERAILDDLLDAQTNQPLDITDHNLNNWLLACYQVQQDDQHLRAAVNEAQIEVSVAFDSLRKTYPQRREYSHYLVPADLPNSQQLAVLGFRKASF
jgi:erythronate-4-phosphate dehydrogenase